MIKVHRERGFSIIQACNPPDLIFLAAAPFKLMGKKFIFDQHDVGPELFVVKYGHKGFLYRALMFFERLSYAMADFVITANATFKDLAVRRGGKAPSRWSRSSMGCPTASASIASSPSPDCNGGRKFVLGYLGIINEQDGVDHFVRAVADLVKVKGFRDFSRRRRRLRAGARIGARAREFARRRRFLRFTGYLSGERLLAHISAFDIGVIPDPFNEANDVMSMNKVFEYCALGIPTACYPLRETKRLLGEAGVYAPTLDPAGLAAACLSLMQDDGLARALRGGGGEAFGGDLRLGERSAEVCRDL